MLKLLVLVVTKSRHHGSTEDRSILTKTKLFSLIDVKVLWVYFGCLRKKVVNEGSVMYSVGHSHENQRSETFSVTESRIQLYCLDLLTPFLLNAIFSLRLKSCKRL